MAVVAGSRSSTGVNAAAFHDFARRGRGPQPGAGASSPRRAGRSCYPADWKSPAAHGRGSVPIYPNRFPWRVNSADRDHTWGHSRVGAAAVAVVDLADGPTLREFVRRMTWPTVLVYTDGWAAYDRLPEVA